MARDWPTMMRRVTAAQYLDLSAAELEREVNAGRLPMPVKLGNTDHWSRTQLDEHLRRITGDGADDWRKASPLYNAA